MTKLSVLFASAVALASPGTAHAASPDGLHIFQGTVDVKKDLPVWSTCTLTAVINVSASVPKLQSASLTGAGLCTGIAFTGLPGTIPLDSSAYPWVAAPDVGMNFPAIGPFPPGTCFGDLNFLWGGTVLPRTITFLTSSSDLPGGPPPDCKIRGIIYQVSGALNLP